MHDRPRSAAEQRAWRKWMEEKEKEDERIQQYREEFLDRYGVPLPSPVEYQGQKKQFYKLVAHVEGRYYSIYDGRTQYIPGFVLSQPVRDGHGGGFYVCESILDLMRLGPMPKNSRLEDAEWAIAKVWGWGKKLQYSNCKIAIEFIEPIDFRPMDKSRIVYTVKEKKKEKKDESKKQQQQQRPPSHRPLTSLLDDRENLRRRREEEDEGKEEEQEEEESAWIRLRRKEQQPDKAAMRKSAIRESVSIPPVDVAAHKKRLSKRVAENLQLEEEIMLMEERLKAMKGLRG